MKSSVQSPWYERCNVINITFVMLLFRFCLINRYRYRYA